MKKKYTIKKKVIFKIVNIKNKSNELFVLKI